MSLPLPSVGCTSVPCRSQVVPSRYIQRAVRTSEGDPTVWTDIAPGFSVNGRHRQSWGHTSKSTGCWNLPILPDYSSNTHNMSTQTHPHRKLHACMHTHRCTHTRTHTPHTHTTHYTPLVSRSCTLGDGTLQSTTMRSVVDSDLLPIATLPSILHCSSYLKGCSYISRW